MELKVEIPQGEFSYIADIERYLVYSFNNPPKPQGHSLSGFVYLKIYRS